MVAAVEIILDQGIRDFVPGLLVEHERADHRLFGGDGIGRNLERLDVFRGLAGAFGHGQGEGSDEEAVVSPMRPVMRSMKPVVE